jgi:N-acetylglucosaminyl-diphospho-decaprenol L-rhamnosyltransferase
VTEAPVVSVIVLNYNGRFWLERCLERLSAQIGAPPHEIIVVDNGSTDGSADEARQRSVRLVETGANLGFAGGNNAGARAARGSLLAFLNNDTVVSPGWLARIHAALENNPEFDLVTSRIVFSDNPGVVDSAGDGYLRAGGGFKLGHGQLSTDYQTSREVFGACGAGFLIRREVFEALGGFDERFFMVYEDVDLSYRARLRGHRIWYAADAIVGHAGSASLGRMSHAAVFYGQRNLEWTWIKNTPASLLWRTAAAHAVYSIAGLVYYARAGRAAAALKGKVAAVRGLPAMLRSRREIQSQRTADVEHLMERKWLSLKRREKRSLR